MNKSLLLEDEGTRKVKVQSSLLVRENPSLSEDIAISCYKQRLCLYLYMRKNIFFLFHL